MKLIIAIVLSPFLLTAVAEDWIPQPYLEYKSELKYVGDNFKRDIHHLRFGAKFGMLYAELGAVTSDVGDGTSAEIGYKFKLSDRFTLKGKWEGTDVDSLFGHKLETEIRFTF